MYKTNRDKLIKPIMIIILITFSILICLFYGRRAFMALDQSIIFDMGYRILEGQIPYIDFYSPNGIPVGLVQALFFKIFGINWFAYCLHAAVFNALFSVIVYFLLISLNLNKYISLIYAFFSAIVFQPPMGTPYFEQSSFFWGLLSFFIIIINSDHKYYYYLLCGLCLTLSYLSKQIPGTFFIIFIFTILFINSMTTSKSFIYKLHDIIHHYSFLIAGIIFSILLLLIWIKFPLDNLYIYALKLPIEIGLERHLGINKILLGIIECFKNIFVNHTWRWKIISLIILTFLALTYRYHFNTANLKKLLYCCGLFLITALFITLTMNQWENGLALIPLAFGISHSIIFSISYDFFKDIKVKYFYFITELLFIIVIILNAYEFNKGVNATRIVQDTKYIENQKQELLPKELSFMNWQIISANYDAQSLFNIIKYLKESKKKFFWFGNSSIIYGLVGQLSPFPALWYHKNLTIPPDTMIEDFNKFQIKSLESLHDVEIFISESTDFNAGIDFNLKMLPKIYNFIMKNYCETKYIDIHGLYLMHRCK